MTFSRTDRPDSESTRWLSAAWEHVTADRVRDLTVGLVDVPSPTGDEAPLAGHIASLLASSGIEGRVMPLDDRQANAWGRLRGDGSGPDLMLYAPIDTMTAGVEAEDVPQIGPDSARTCACPRRCFPEPRGFPEPRATATT